MGLFGWRQPIVPTRGSRWRLLQDCSRAAAARFSTSAASRRRTGRDPAVGLVGWRQPEVEAFPSGRRLFPGLLPSIAARFSTSAASRRPTARESSSGTTLVVTTNVGNSSPRRLNSRSGNRSYLACKGGEARKEGRVPRGFDPSFVPLCSGVRRIGILGSSGAEVLRTSPSNPRS